MSVNWGTQTDLFQRIKESTNGKDILDLNLLQKVYFGGEGLLIINNLMCL